MALDDEERKKGLRPATSPTGGPTPRLGFDTCATTMVPVEAPLVQRAARNARKRLRRDGQLGPTWYSRLSTRENSILIDEARHAAVHLGHTRDDAREFYQTKIDSYIPGRNKSDFESTEKSRRASLADGKAGHGEGFEAAGYGAAGGASGGDSLLRSSGEKRLGRCIHVTIKPCARTAGFQRDKGLPIRGPQRRGLSSSTSLPGRMMARPAAMWEGLQFRRSRRKGAPADQTRRTRPGSLDHVPELTSACTRRAPA